MSMLRIVGIWLLCISVTWKIIRELSTNCWTPRELMWILKMIREKPFYYKKPYNISVEKIIKASMKA